MSDRDLVRDSSDDDINPSYSEVSVTEGVGETPPMLALAVTSPAPSRKRSASIFTTAKKAKREKIRPSTSSAREKVPLLSATSSVSASAGAGGGSSRKTAPSTVSRLDPKKSSGEPSSDHGPSGTPLIVPGGTPTVSQVTDGDPPTLGGGKLSKEKEESFLQGFPAGP